MTAHINEGCDYKDVLLLSTIEETKCGHIITKVHLRPDGEVKYVSQHFPSEVYVVNTYSYEDIVEVGLTRIAEGMINKLVKEMMSPPDSSED